MKENLKNVNNSLKSSINSEIQLFQRDFLDIFEKLFEKFNKIKEIDDIKQSLNAMNKKNEEITKKYLKKLDCIQLTEENPSENQAKIIILTKRIKEMTYILNEYERKKRKIIRKPLISKKMRIKSFRMN